MPSLSARLTEAADALEDDLPEGVAVIDNLDGSPSLDELDRYCAGLMLEAAEALARSPTPADGGRDRREEVARVILRRDYLGETVERMEKWRSGGWLLALELAADILALFPASPGGSLEGRQTNGDGQCADPQAVQPRSELDQAWEAVNVLGAPDTACTTDEDRAYCRAIGDALEAIEKLGGRAS